MTTCNRPPVATTATKIKADANQKRKAFNATGAISFAAIEPSEKDPATSAENINIAKCPLANGVTISPSIFDFLRNKLEVFVSFVRGANQRA